MKIIVGLGNPGTQYKETRHNIGFLFLDYLKDNISFQDFKDSKFKGVISEGLIGGEKIILLKPLTYMNLSGQSIKEIVNFYKLDYKKDLIVVFDDISMGFGKIRFRDKGSSGGHNGIKSIISESGSEDFLRIKIGIGNNTLFETSDWVLSKFSKDELIDLNNKIFPEAQELINEVLNK